MDFECRVCLQPRDIMVDLFENVDQYQVDLASLLNDCGGMVVDKDDAFPKYLCQQCTQELLLAAEFRHKCQEAMKLMKVQQQQGGYAALIEESNETEALTDRSETQDSSNELFSLDAISEDSEQRLEESCEIDKEESQPKLDAVHLNVLFENNSTIDSCCPSSDKTSTIDTPENLDNVVQLSHKGDQTVADGNASEDDGMEDDCVTYMDVFDASESSNEFADSIIENLENGETEPDCGTTEISYPESLPKSTENFQHVCEACGASFVRFINLQRHMQFEHSAKLKFSCEKCHLDFDTESDYSRHEDICYRDALKKNKLNSFQTEKTVPKEGQTFNKHICEYCGKCLQSLFSLRMHLRTHTGERPYSCDQCQSQFKTQSALNSHKKRHTGKADLICEICEKRFYDISNLITHRRVHTGHKPHKCNICNRGFSRVYLLQLHMRTHTGERPFKCVHCPKSFAQSSDLKYHLTTHNGERKHSCKICSKSFVRKSKLELHMKTHTTEHIQESPEANSSQSTEENMEFFTTIYNDLDLIDLNFNEEGLN